MDFGPCSSWSFLGRVDAATRENHGGGGFIFDPKRKKVLAFYHVWTEEERASAMVVERVSTTVLEAYAAVLWFRVFSHLCEGSRVLLESDSEPFVMSLEAAFSERALVESCVREIRSHVASNYISLRVRHVLGPIFNEIADHLSHARVEDARCLVRSVFGCEMTLVPCGPML